MDFIGYKEMIKNAPYPETLEFCQAVMWLHPEVLPLGVISIGEDYPAVVRIPGHTVNRFGRTVPVITIARDAFAGRDKITDIVLPSTIDRIPPGAFAGCSGLERITIPRKLNSIRKGTFAGCDRLKDVYYEGSMEEWENVQIVHNKHEIEFGGLIPETPVHGIKEERLVHVPGNDALLTANIHFHCALSDAALDPGFELTVSWKDVTELFQNPGSGQDDES